MSINSPILRKKRSRGSVSPRHELVIRPTHTRMWNTGDNGWTKTKTEYVKIKCATFKMKIKPIATEIRRFLCAHNVIGSVFLTVVTQTI